MRIPIYLDYMATTPVDPRVAAKMQHYLTADADGVFGNPSSSHYYGYQARAAVDNARRQLASLINAAPDEIIWTSGATEANNLALKGAAQFYQRQGKHIVTSATEHHAVLEPLRYLATQGFDITYLHPASNGLLNLAELEEILRRRTDTIMVSVMHVNNEIGVIQDIAAIGQLTRAHGVLLHVDAAQSVGKIAVDVRASNIDLLSCTAHKIYGPKGVGALYVRGKPRLHLVPQVHGGGQERALRAGTLAVAQIVGMGEACALAECEMADEGARVFALRQHFLQSIKNCCSAHVKSNVRSSAQLDVPDDALPFNAQTDTSLCGAQFGMQCGAQFGMQCGAQLRIQMQVHGDLEKRVAGNLNVSFIGIDAEVLLAAFSDIAVSHGAACNSFTMEPSHVLLALGVSRETAASAIRFSFGRFTTRAEVDYAIQHVCDVLEKLMGRN